MRGFWNAKIGVGYFLSAAVAYSQSANASLTLEDCVRKAMAAPSALSIARLDVQISERDRQIARAGLLPQAKAYFGTAYTSPSITNPQTYAFIPANAIREYIGLGGIFQEIDTSGRIRAELARARANQQAARASAGIAERDLKRAVSNAYYRLLLTRRIVDALVASITESENFEQRVKQLAANGEAARADVVKASSQLAGLRQALISARLAATLANQDLAAYWTEDVDQLLVIQDTFAEALPEPETEFAKPAEFRRRYEFSLLEAQKVGFQADARRARAAMMPQLSWSFNYGLDSYRVDWQHRGFSAVVALNVPIFDWFRARNSARQFNTRAAQINETKSVSERRFSQEYRAAAARVKQLHEQVLQSKEQVGLAEEDFKLSRIRYEGGEGAAVDVVVSQNQLVQALINYYSSIANFYSARLDLEVASGR
jgi:outer membrane protein TolC